MKSPSFISACLLLALAVPAWGQSAPLPTPPTASPPSSPSTSGEAHRPLNLALPRDALVQPPSPTRNEADELASRNVQQVDADQRIAPPRYGTGYEARRRGMAAAGSGASMGRGAALGAGRGGMGRRR